MKFYYGNKLARTSKTHTYTHAILTLGETVVSCHTSREAAEKKIRSELAWNEKARKENDKILAGHPVLLEKARRSCDAYEKVIKSWRIVELEARA